MGITMQQLTARYWYSFNIQNITETFKNPMNKTLILAAAFGVAGIATVNADIVVNTDTSTTNFDAFAGNISTTDLLTTATVSAGVITNGGTAVLTDGAHGVDFAGWTNPAIGESVTWDLGTGTGLGWDITEVNSISAFGNDALGGQEFTLEYATTAAPTTFIQLGGRYGPLGGGGTGIVASEINITDDTGTLATGVQFIRFTGRFGVNPGYRELDVMGTATVPEPGTYALFAGLIGLSYVMVRRRG